LPEGYERTTATPASFAAFLRDLPLLPHQTAVTLYNGTTTPHRPAAIIDMETGTENLQKSAQAAMRLWGEYLFEQHRFPDIHFHIRNGKAIAYDEWARGMKIVVDNQGYWTKTPNNPRQHRIFRLYLNFIFKHSDFQTLQQDVAPVAPDKLTPGDLLLFRNSAGEQRVLIIVDMAVHRKTNEKILLLATGGDPAQSIHIITPPATDDTPPTPWFPLTKKGTVTIDDVLFSAENFFRLK
jgi:hypothetical protein